jgi:hypothetical protein
MPLSVQHCCWVECGVNISSVVLDANAVAVDVHGLSPIGIASRDNFTQAFDGVLGFLELLKIRDASFKFPDPFVHADTYSTQISASPECVSFPRGIFRFEVPP